MEDLKTLPWKKTNIYKKVQHQEVVMTNTIFNNIREVIDTDMTDSEVQRKFEEDFECIRHEILKGSSSKDIYGPNRYFVGDRWGHENSVRIRIPSKAMKEIIGISRSTINNPNLFE